MGWIGHLPTGFDGSARCSCTTTLGAVSEEDAIDRIAPESPPVTARSLAADLRALGVPAGGLVLTHSSLSALGWVAGGPEAVVAALLAALGPDGTLVVPSFSTG